MLIILSPRFLNSESCDFQTKFAQSLSPGEEPVFLLCFTYSSSFENNLEWTVRTPKFVQTCAYPPSMSISISTYVQELMAPHKLLVKHNVGAIHVW